MSEAQNQASDARSRISDLIGRMSRQGTSHAETLLSELDVAGLLESCLDAADRSILAAIRDESYIHANGFYRISFPGTDSSSVRIRLHVWHGGPSGGPRYGESDAHNHKWPFASRVLVGGLQHEFLRVASAAGQYKHFRHVDLGDRYELIPAGQVSLDVTGMELTPAGTVYGMTPETIHRVVPHADQYSATLVAELERLSDVTDVFSEVDRHEAGQIKPRRLDIAEITHELRRVIEVLRDR